MEVMVDQYNGTVLRVDNPLADDVAAQAFEDWRLPPPHRDVPRPDEQGALGAARPRNSLPGSERDPHLVARPTADELRSGPGPAMIARRLLALAVAVAACACACARGDLVVAPATTTTDPSELPAISDRDEEQILQALGIAASFTAGFDERLPYLEDSTDLRGPAEQVAELARSFNARVEVGPITGTAEADRAQVTVDVLMGTTALLEDAPITLHRQDGQWRVTRSGVCTIISIVTPCPEPPGSTTAPTDPGSG